MVKLHKSFHHWAGLCGFRPQSRSSRRWFATDRRGYKGAIWRVTCHGELECTPTEDFDRWANADIVVRRPLPTSKNEFISAITNMLKEINDVISLHRSSRNS